MSGALFHRHTATATKEPARAAGVGTLAPSHPFLHAVLGPSVSWRVTWWARMGRYEGIFARINASFGTDLTHYWMWTPESYQWSHPTKTSQEWIDARGDMLAAHGVWARPGADYAFRLATAGWTLGPMEDAAWLDSQLPGDFDALSGLVNRLGREHVQGGYANCSRHRTWVMPWMESDDALGWPEIWVNRTLSQGDEAQLAGASGLIGLQWRTEEVAPQLAALAQRGWKRGSSASFWLDYCRANFAGNDTELAADMASLLATVDGDAESVFGAELPLFTSCCPGHITRPPPVAFCANLTAAFAFASQWSILGQRVAGVGNIARFRRWNSTFAYFEAGARVACLLGDFNAAVAAAGGNVSKLKATALPIRVAMVETWDGLMARVLETVSTRGALGTLQNMNALTKPTVMDRPGQALAAAIGEAVPQPSSSYGGRPRVLQLNQRSVYNTGEPFLVEAAVLAPSGPAANVTLWFSKVPDGGQAPEGWASIALPRTAPGRGLYGMVTGPMTFDFDYYLEACWADASCATWPEAAPAELLSAVQVPPSGSRRA